MAHKIQIKRGNKADLPTLDVGEFGLCQDTNELFIGNSGNQKIFPPTAPTTARFVVGTSTSGWTAKDCDYLCDGTDDQIEINNAITALPATGGEIVILDGTYNIVSSILITRNNVSLKGTIGTILKSQGNFHMINLDSVENCSVEGLTLDGNNKATSTSSRLVSLANTKKCNVSKNQLQNWEAFGIYATGGSDDVGYTSITDNLISNVRTGISASRTNNLIANNRLYSGSNTGIHIRLAINTLCIGNVIEDYNIGILIENNSRGVTVTGNTIRNSETSGITLTATEDNNIIGNTIIKGDGTPGDYTEAQYSIHVYGVSSNNNLISLNNCMGKAPVVEGGTGNTLVNNKFDDSDDIQALNEQISTVSGDVAAHKAENAAEDNVHGLRGIKILLGANSSAHGTASYPISIGQNAYANNMSIAIGRNAFASGNLSLALGRDASTSATNSIAIGRSASALNDREGVLGTATSNLNATNKWYVPGDFSVEGTKNFEIPHPKPEKKATHRIRHGAVESPTAGDTLYRWKVQATKDNDIQYIDLPDYFIHLNKDVQIFVTGQGHFGNGYGVLNRETEQLEIHCQLEGEYNILAIGTRNDDHQSVKDWDIKGVEREIGESWTGETYTFSVDEIIEVEEIKEELV